ncbi:MAG: metallophosphoesterase [Candidatus Hydrogenedentales bacterium]
MSISSFLLRRGALLLVSGLVLFACVAPNEYMLTPARLESAAGVVYRMAYFVVLPARLVVMHWLPSVNHHWPVAHTAVVSLFAPFFWYALWRFARRVHRFLAHEMPSPAPLNPSRRAFISGAAAGSVSLALGGGTAYGALLEPQRIAVRNYTLPIRNLPPAFERFRIVHIADTHYGPFVSLAFINDAIQRANGLRPDLVVLTGDYVHRNRKGIADGIGVFRNLQSRFGAVAVLGNHDHWEDADTCREVFADMRLPLLDNTRRFLTASGWTDSPANDAICIGGVGDMYEDEVDFERATGALPHDMPRLILSHNPDTAETIPPHLRVDALFCGHTHGGQVRLPILGVPAKVTVYGNKYLGGYCHGPQCPVLVSRGVGLGGIPLRFRVPPEISVTVLRRTT